MCLPPCSRQAPPSPHTTPGRHCPSFATSPSPPPLPPFVFLVSHFSSSPLSPTSAPPQGVLSTSKPAAAATQACEPITEAGVARLFDEWNQKLVRKLPQRERFSQPHATQGFLPGLAHSLSTPLPSLSFSLSQVTGTPKDVADMYWANGSVLLATLEDKPLITPAEKEAYFVEFQAKKPSGKINERIIELGCNLATDSGVYTFTLGATDPPTKVPARYTYTYTFDPAQKKWKISTHHSSKLPSAATKPAPAPAPTNASAAPASV